MKRVLFSAIFITFIINISSVCKGSELGLLDLHQLKRDMPKWIILDARPVKSWEKSHIPGSISLSWEQFTRTDENQVPYRILPPEKMAQALGKLGISAQSPVVIYGDADQSWGGEGWGCWMFAWIGHQGTVKLLNGGIQAWSNNNYPLVSAESEGKTLTGAANNGEELFTLERKALGRAPVTYVAKPLTEINITARDIHDHADSYQLVDTRSTMEWFRGHLPGAVHIQWEKFFKGDERSPLSAKEVKALLRKNGIDIEREDGVNFRKQVVYYCTGGIRSGYAWMVHQLAGLPDALNFEGGYAEWDKVYP